MVLSSGVRHNVSLRLLPVALAVLASCLSVVSAASTPLVLAPAEFTAGSSVSVRVHGTVGANGLTVVLADVTTRDTPSTVASATAVAANGDAQTVLLTVPASADVTNARYKLRLFASSAAPSTMSAPIAEHDVKVLASPELSVSSIITVGANVDTITLVTETDKPAYKPGQDVNARALAFTANDYAPKTGVVTFTFRDPQVRACCISQIQAHCLLPLFECTTRDVCSICTTTYITSTLFAHTVHP